MFKATLSVFVVGKVVYVSMYDVETAGENSAQGIMVSADNSESFVQALPTPIGNDSIVDIISLNWISQKDDETVNRANNNAVLRLKRDSQGKILPRLYVENGTKDKTPQEWKFSNITFLPFSASGIYIAI